MDGQRTLRSSSGHAVAFVLLPLVGGMALAVLGAHRWESQSGHPVAASFIGVARDATASPVVPSVDPEQVLTQYCVGCHNERRGTAGLAFDTMNVADPGASAPVWEKVISRLRAGTMPPGGSRRPDALTYDSVATWIEAELDKAWAANPNPGRINALHRLNRTEYGNAIRDLFDLDIDVQPLLVGDETADGSFDNFAAVLSFTPAHLDRYASVARQVTRLATGLPPIAPETRTYEVPLHVLQDDYRGTDLPLGSRGGVAVTHHFPVSGEYEIEVRLRRQYQDYIMGMGWAQQAELRLDGALIERFTVGGNAPGDPPPRSYAGAGNQFGDPEWEVFMHAADDGLRFRISAEAGPGVLGVAFLREHWEPEFVPQLPQRGRVLTNDEQYMEYAGIHSVEIRGPYQVAGTVDDTPSRRRVFSCHPDRGAEEVACATEILSRMARSAFRRPVSEQDVADLLVFYEQGASGGGFDEGIQFALERLLVDPEFLFRVYREPQGVEEGEAYALSDLEVASRLSFFLWSGLPDERLLDLAEQGSLTDPAVLESEVQRLLADPRSMRGLVEDFTAQWLNLRLLDEKLADPDIYPEFDDNLLEAFESETKLFVASTIEEDASLRTLLDADYTFLNERLARHYRIPGVYGTRFRRVSLPDAAQRGGLLAHGSLLSVSSYPDRTSPVLRGKWLLDNILGAPVSPPPPNVDTNLQEEEGGTTSRTIRERLEAHRSQPLCASCHSVMDPLGFALESFDAVGMWRDFDVDGRPIDNVGTWPTGLEIQGFSGLRTMLLDHEEQFVGAVTRKLMAYALGRPLEYYDQPTVRRVVREAATNDYRWSSIVLGIVQSPAFLMRTASGVAAQQ